MRMEYWGNWVISLDCVDEATATKRAGERRIEILTQLETGVGVGKTGRSDLFHAANHTAAWWEDGAWVKRRQIPTGTLIVSCDTHLAFLQLHHGNRRVSIEEATAILGLPMDEALA